MGKRKITIRQSVAVSISQIAWYIEFTGMPKAAEDFSDAVYDFIQKLSEEKRRFPVCREPSRALLKYKCMTFKKKYTVVFIETELEITVCEFTSSKLFKW